MIAGVIICFIISIIFIIGVIFTIIKHDIPYVVLFGFMALFSGGAGALLLTCEEVPTEHDVFTGKAVYQETIHITGNDTIKTYKIVWKQN